MTQVCESLLRSKCQHCDAAGIRVSGGSTCVEITTHHRTRRTGKQKYSSFPFVISLCLMSRFLNSAVAFDVYCFFASLGSLLQITFNYGGSEIDFASHIQGRESTEHAENTNRRTKILGKRSAAPIEERNDKDYPKSDEIQMRKSCMCGAARCCGYLPCH